MEAKANINSQNTLRKIEKEKYMDMLRAARDSNNVTAKRIALDTYYKYNKTLNENLEELKNLNSSFKARLELAPAGGKANIQLISKVIKIASEDFDTQSLKVFIKLLKSAVESEKKMVTSTTLRGMEGKSSNNDKNIKVLNRNSTDRTIQTTLEEILSKLKFVLTYIFKSINE